MNITELFRLILFLLSCLGYWEYLRRNTSIAPCFYPSAVIALQVTVLFFAGVFSFLTICTLLLFGTGLLLLAGYIWKDRSISFLKKYGSAEYLFALLMLVLTVFSVRGCVFARRDNFTHWALVVKQMLMTNRFPNFLDDIITFQEYPLGSAVYIYYMAKIVSREESFQMLAQAFMMITLLMPVFSWCRRNKMAAVPVALFSANFILLYNVQIYELHVDTLLPLAGICGLLFLWQNCGSLENRRAECFAAAAYLILMTQIKNSGILFATIGAMWLLAGIRKDGDYRRRIPLALSPYAVVFLWKRHCAYVFAGAAVTKHAMTVKYLLGEFRQKSGSTILAICRSMLRFTVTDREVWVVFACLAVLVFVACMVWKNRRREFVLLYLSCVLLFAVYQVGMTLMYIFSMNETEAMILASADRYTKTILTVIIYIITCLAAAVISESTERKNLWRSAVAAGVIVGCMLGTVGGFALISDRARVFEITGQGKNSELEKRTWVSDLAEEYDIPEQDSYCFLIKTKTDSYYLRLSQYLFRVSNAHLIYVESPADLEEISEHYVFVEDRDNPAIQQWIGSHYPDQLGNEVIVRE